MKLIALFVPFFTASSFAADFTAWQFTQPLEVKAAGLQSIALPPETLNVARSALEDLRVISPSGVETPLVIQWPEIQSARLIDPAKFEMSLGDGVTELRIATGTTERIRAIHLRAAAAKFLKAARVEASADGVSWQGLVASAILFREPNNAESATIQLPAQSHAHLRVIVDDKTSPAVAFSGARLELDGSEPETSALKTTLKSAEELNGRTRLTIDLGDRNVFVAALHLEASDSVFSRRVSVTGVKATVFRIALGDQSSESLRVPLHRAVADDKLELEIENGDSPPLKIAGVKVTQHPVQVLFHASEAGVWRLISGNALAPAPRYDIAAIKSQLTSATAARITPGAIMSSKEFKKPTALPEVEAKGIDVDLAMCRYRRPVIIRSPGVITIELDAEVLSHCQLSRGDLRLVQNGGQIPFIFDYVEGPWTRFVEATMKLTPDAKRPRVTVWTVTMPHESLPADRLVCTSPTALFDRQIRALASVKDSFGNPAQQHLGSAHWTRKPGDATKEFALRFDPSRVPGTFTLETDNGDNPPVELATPRVYYPTVRVMAKVTDAAPLFLYYGNERAAMPQYDLRLVRTEMESAPKDQAALGPEEKLIAGDTKERASSAGSPWLWVALAVVVGALLWVVARMLPSVKEGSGAE